MVGRAPTDLICFSEVQLKTFFLQFKVIPTNVNEYFDLIKGALASCWIQANSSQSAVAKAKFHVLKSDWNIVKIDYLPVEVTKRNFIKKDVGLEQYLRTQEEGIAVVYVAWARDGKMTGGPFPIRPSYNFNLCSYLKKQKQLANQGRCLHYESGPICNEIIKAHSIQKNRSLSAIADKGHVYKLATSIASLKKNKGKPIFKKYGVNKTSIFLGFCQKHDNELFAPIDNTSLVPTDFQVLLYAYRSICKEVFVKENALELLESQLENVINQKAIEDLLIKMKLGTTFGLENLRRHKKIYDNSLSENSHSETRYVLFVSKQEPTVAFSGLFYPDFDFMGRALQDLGDHNIQLELITFCSAPMASGWGFLFAWHTTSSNVCIDFMKSLATMIHNNDNALGDFLFRLVVTTCENLAISPKWWEGLPLDKKNQITSNAFLMTDIFSATNSSYLREGLEGISPWKFERVISNMG